MSAATTMVQFSGKGMNGAISPFLLDATQVHRAINCRLDKQMWRTRYGFQAQKIIGISSEVDAYRCGNTQGAIYYNPARGQGALSFSDDLAQIAESSAGQMWSVQPAGAGALRVVDISGGLRSPRHLHLAWLCQAENYLIRTDGIGKTWVYDGAGGAEFSPGYIATGANREASRIPNRAGVVVYAHGRLHVVLDGHRIIVGDSLHRVNQTSAKNILEFTESTYWATGQWFSPPSAMGAVLAAGILPTQDTQHGHAEVMFHGDNGGVFSVNTNVFPRSDWANQALTRHALLNTAAAGPYAMVLSDGDQIFRSRKGIQTLRSARGERNVMGSPYSNLAAEVQVVMAGDREEDLRFATVARWEKAERILASVYPMVSGNYRWHRGFVVLNMLPGEGRPDAPPAWEGLWTLPHWAGGVTQFCGGIFDGYERMFAICWNNREKRKSILEADADAHSDTTETGDHERISCQLMTKVLSVGGVFRSAELHEGFLYLSNVRTDLDWGVWFRINGRRKWQLWKTGFESMPEPSDIWSEGDSIEDGARPLGSIPASDFHAIQFLIRWKGAASVQLQVQHSSAKAPETDVRFSPSEVTCDYDDYEYNNPGARWEEVPLCR